MTEAATHGLSINDQQTPLLSICIPTCNRAGFLRVMLQALLPQAAKCNSEVEVWVIDNASTDGTREVLQQSRSLGPFQVHRQPENVGPSRNIVHGPTRLARGRYTWILGDHNLLRPDALSTVLKKISENADVDAFYVNFRVATYPAQWPASAIDGYDGPFTYLGNPELTAETVNRWVDLIRPYSAACTQNYVHIAKTAVWKRFWEGRDLAQDYTSAISTYPHTVTMLQTVGRQPASIIVEPMITIFNNAQSWNNPRTRLKVYFTGLPELLAQIQEFGLAEKSLSDLWVHFFRPQATQVALEAYRHLGRIRTFVWLLKNAKTCHEVRRIILITLPEGFSPGTTSAIRRLIQTMKNYRNWYVYNFRPARWIRRILNAEN